MVRIAKWLFGLIGVICLVLVGAVVVFATPDTDRAAMIAKYGGDQARFAQAPSGLQVHYRVSGPAEAPALLLIHGSSSSLHTWEPITPLLDAGYRVIAMDLPGHGLTGPHPQHDYSFASNSAAVSAVLEAEQIAQAVLIGSSYGGWTAWRHALSRPDQVTGLVLIDAAGMPRAEGEAPPSSNLAFTLLSTDLGGWLLERITPRALVAQSLRQSVSVQDIVTEQMIDRYWELIRFPGNRAAAVESSKTDREMGMAARLGEVDVPVLIIWGAEDQLIPLSAATQFQARLPAAELVVLDNVGHLPMEEDPQETATAILSFLRENGN